MRNVRTKICCLGEASVTSRTQERITNTFIVGVFSDIFQVLLLPCWTASFSLGRLQVFKKKNDNRHLFIQTPGGTLCTQDKPDCPVARISIRT